MLIQRIALVICLALSPAVAVAQTVQDSIIAQLTAQGFSEIRVNRTFLGRVRIIALSDDLRREIVFNPGNGGILRDYWVELDDDGDRGGPRLLDPRDDDGRDDDGRGNGGRDDRGSGDDDDGRGSGGNDDEPDDDDEDDGEDKDDDESDDDDENDD